MLKKIAPVLFILAGMAVASAFFLVFNTEKVLKPEEAAQKAVSYINENLLDGVQASLVSVSAENGSGNYALKLKIDGKEFESYVTKDGKILFGQGIIMDPVKSASSTPDNTQPVTQENPKEAPKTDKPDVKLFVMSYCPYGLQAQKALLPVYNLLKDKANIGVYFVNYVMHDKKEIDENLVQYCIQKDQKSKYSSYVACFAKSGKSSDCLAYSGVDTTKLNSCVAATDNQFKVTEGYNDKSTWVQGKFPKFGVDADLNTEYGVQGSPTMVINGTTVEASPRSPENFKSIICSAFNSAPSECSQKLSDEVASPGIGEGTATTGASAGTCQ